MSDHFFTNNHGNTLLVKLKGVFQNLPDIECFDALVGYFQYRLNNIARANTNIQDQQIENLIYRIEDLTYEEVKVIDPEFGLSEEENSIALSWMSKIEG